MARNTGNPWCEKQDNVIIGYLNKGLSNKEIADRMGRTEFAIKCRLSNLGYKDVDDQCLEMTSPTILNTTKETAMKNRTVTTKTYVGNTDASTLSVEQLIEVIEQEESFIKRLYGISVSEAREKLLEKHKDNLSKLEGLLGLLV